VAAHFQFFDLFAAAQGDLFLSLGYCAAATDLGAFLAVFSPQNRAIAKSLEGNSLRIDAAATLPLLRSFSCQINLRNPSKIAISEPVTARFRLIFSKWGCDKD